MQENYLNLKINISKLKMHMQHTNNNNNNKFIMLFASYDQKKIYENEKNKMKMSLRWDEMNAPLTQGEAIIMQ